MDTIRQCLSSLRAFGMSRCGIFAKFHHFVSLVKKTTVLFNYCPNCFGFYGFIIFLFLYIFPHQNVVLYMCTIIVCDGD